MALAVDTNSSKSISPGAVAGGTMTWSHTCNGSNRLLVVGVAVRSDGATPTNSGVTYNAVAMTAVPSAVVSDADEIVKMWYLINPASGANNIVVTFGDNGANSCYPVGGGVSFTGADQTTGIHNGANSSNAGSTTPSLTVTSTGGEIVIDAVEYRSGSGVTLTVDGSQTQQVNWWSNATAADPPTDTRRETLGMSTEAGAASVAMDWTISTSQEWKQAGLSVIAAAGGAAANHWLLMGV